MKEIIKRKHLMLSLDRSGKHLKKEIFGASHKNDKKRGDLPR